VTQIDTTHDAEKPWAFFRHAAQEMLWPHIEQEYREELQGIADGAIAHGVKLDLWDVVAMNAAEEWSYYVKRVQQGTQHQIAGVGDRARALQRLRGHGQLHQGRPRGDRPQ